MSPNTKKLLFRPAPVSLELVSPSSFEEKQYRSETHLLSSLHSQAHPRANPSPRRNLAQTGREEIGEYSEKREDDQQTAEMIQEQ